MRWMVRARDGHGRVFIRLFTTARPAYEYAKIQLNRGLKVDIYKLVQEVWEKDELVEEP